MHDTPRNVLEGAHATFARSFNGRTWDLLAKPDRTEEEDEEMLLAASASLYHWMSAGTAVHAQRGQWLLARVYGELGRPQDALRHAQRCLALTKDNPDGMEDFDRAYAQEALARAFALLGEEAAANEHRRSAEEAGKAIADEESRRIFMTDLAAGRWLPEA